MNEKPCCPDDDGGSHYHCAFCGCSCSMQGHYGNGDNTYYCPPLSERPSWAASFVDTGDADVEPRSASAEADLVVGHCTHVGVPPRAPVVGGHDYACATCIADAFRKLGLS